MSKKQVTKYVPRIGDKVVPGSLPHYLQEKAWKGTLLVVDVSKEEPSIKVRPMAAGFEPQWLDSSTVKKAGRLKYGDVIVKDWTIPVVQAVDYRVGDLLPIVGTKRMRFVPMWAKEDRDDYLLSSKCITFTELNILPTLAIGDTVRVVRDVDIANEMTEYTKDNCVKTVRQGVSLTPKELVWEYEEGIYTVKSVPTVKIHPFHRTPYEEVAVVGEDGSRYTFPRLHLRKASEAPSYRRIEGQIKVGSLVRVVKLSRLMIAVSDPSYVNSLGDVGTVESIYSGKTALCSFPRIGMDQLVGTVCYVHGKKAGGWMQDINGLELIEEQDK
jgi:hypothetical protein